jgi:hypothetical protein
MRAAEGLASVASVGRKSAAHSAILPTAHLETLWRNSLCSSALHSVISLRPSIARSRGPSRGRPEDCNHDRQGAFVAPCMSLKPCGLNRKRTLEQALPPDEVSDSDPLYRAAVAVEQDEALAAEMAEWETATIDDGLPSESNRDRSR